MSARDLTIESMKMEMHGMGAEIKELRAKLSIAEKKLDLAVKGLERIKLYFKKVGGGTSVFPYIPMSRGDYEMGERGGFNAMATIAAVVLNNIKEVK